VAQLHAPQAPMHPQPQMRPQPQPAPHVTANAAHRPNEKG
jgi:hypothetical protein